MADNLEKAVEKAIQQQDKSDVQIEEPRKEVPREESRRETPEPLFDEDTENGRTLIRALKDPGQAPLIIDFLARQAGYIPGSLAGATRQEVREAKDNISNILERHLGEEFKFLVPKLAPAIKESIESLRGEEAFDSTSDIRERLDRSELRSIESEVSATHNDLAKDYFGTEEMPDEIAEAMNKAMDEFPPSDPNMSPDQYYRKIFYLVAGERGISRKSGARDRIDRSRRDSPARSLSSMNRGIAPENSGNPRKMSLTDAVSLAMRQIDRASEK